MLLSQLLMSIWLSPEILAPAESAMPWDLFIYKATSLAEVDL